MPKIIGIMACTKNGVIALDGKLPWYIAAETKHFKDTIKNHPLIMGRKTFDNLPDNLKSQNNIVFSKDKNKISNKTGTFISSLNEMNLKAKEKYFFIGGAVLLKLFLQNNLVDEFILTIIKKDYQGDTFLNMNLFSSWQKKLIKSENEFDVFHLNFGHAKCKSHL